MPDVYFVLKDDGTGLHEQAAIPESVIAFDIVAGHDHDGVNSHLISGAGIGHTLDGAAHTDVGAITEAQGQLLFYGGSLWMALNPGNSGEFLKTQGAGANPAWAVPDHGSIGGLADDDHSQYHTDARGDARYYTETELTAGQLDTRYFTEAEHIAASAGVGDAGKPIVLDAAGHVDASMLDDGDIDHGSIGGLGDDDHTQYFLLAGETTDAKLYSGADLKLYSDAGVTEKASIDGATGNITTVGTIVITNLAPMLALDETGNVTWQLKVDGDQFMFQRAGIDKFVITTDWSIWKKDARLYDGADLVAYSDNGVTEKARIDGATGNITTVGTVDGKDVSELALTFVRADKDSDGDYDLLTAAAWENVTKSGSGTINWNTVFGVPTAAKAVQIQAVGSGAASRFFLLKAKSTTTIDSFALITQALDQFNLGQGIVPIAADGTSYYTFDAAYSNFYLRIVGWYI